MVLNETIIDLEKRFTSGVKVDTHPWHGLDESSGIYSLDPTIRKIAERTLALNEQVANVTAIRPINGIEARSWCHAELVRNRLSVGTSMLVSDPLGELMQVATLADRGKNTYAEFDTIGNYDQLLSLELARMRIGAGGLEKLHLQYLEALVGLPENGLLIEVGAGSFYERILALNAIALKRKGHFICHDATPAAVKAARGEVPEIPYWALPPLTQFLGKALTEVASPVVLTSKNVITSMSYERMTDLLAICRDAKAERLVMSLSLQFNASNPSIPHSHRVSQSILVRF
jgi:hypothetical protein